MDDYISRQAAIENSFEVYTKEYGWCEVVGVDAISELPSAQQWTPCSTEMPPTGKDVLVTLVDGAVTDGERWKPQEGKWFLFSDGVNGLDEDVLAWMPLPAPYRPEGDDKHEE